MYFIDVQSLEVLHGRFETMPSNVIEPSVQLFLTSPWYSWSLSSGVGVGMIAFAGGAISGVAFTPGIVSVA